MIAGLGWFAIQHWSKTEEFTGMVHPATTQPSAPAAAPTAKPVKNSPVNTASFALRYVHRKSEFL